jgi:hypothetical protein
LEKKEIDLKQMKEQTDQKNPIPKYPLSLVGQSTTR